MKKINLLLTSVILLSSCSYVHQTGDKIITLYKKGKDYIIEPDSIKNLREQIYLDEMSSKHPEYLNVVTFFKENNEQVLEKNGDLYPIVDVNILDNGSIIHNAYNSPNEVKYLYKTEDNFYIYTFQIKASQIDSCTNIRRIRNGYFKEPVHDLIFENNRLIKEEFVSEVSKKFYDENGIQYFRVSKKFDNGEVVNKYNLGPIKNF